MKDGTFTLIVEQPQGVSYRNRVVRFKIGTIEATQTAIWHEGGAEKLLLTAFRGGSNTSQGRAASGNQLTIQRSQSPQLVPGYAPDTDESSEHELRLRIDQVEEELREERGRLDEIIDEREREAQADLNRINQEYDDGKLRLSRSNLGTGFQAAIRRLTREWNDLLADSNSHSRIELDRLSRERQDLVDRFQHKIIELEQEIDQVNRAKRQRLDDEQRRQHDQDRRDQDREEREQREQERRELDREDRKWEEQLELDQEQEGRDRRDQDRRDREQERRDQEREDREREEQHRRDQERLDREQRDQERLEVNLRIEELEQELKLELEKIDDERHRLELELRAELDQDFRLLDRRYEEEKDEVRARGRGRKGLSTTNEEMQALGTKYRVLLSQAEEPMRAELASIDRKRADIERTFQNEIDALKRKIGRGRNGGTNRGQINPERRTDSLQPSRIPLEAPHQDNLPGTPQVEAISFTTDTEPQPSSVKRGFFTNSLSSTTGGGADKLLDPTSLAIIGIILTVVATGLQLVRGR